jgi:CDP-6-deoxy-D-xylo-4-hexulose-3-dehydrase
MNSEQSFRTQILDNVKEYAAKFLKNKEYKTGDRINYAGRVFDHEEVVNLVDSALDFWLTQGRYIDVFEKELSDYFGIKYVSTVNSGSSANLLAMAALSSPLLGDKAVKANDEVITVAAGFPSTIAPIIQSMAVPVFVDVTIPDYNIDTSVLDKAYSNKTKAVFLAHTLGNTFDIKTVKQFCKEKNIWLIEDNCDALGSLYNIDGEYRLTGTIGDIGTSSFYPAHHMTTGEGGAVYTDNTLLNKIVRSLRDWGKDCVCPSGIDNLCGHRYDGQYGDLPKGYDHKYVYSHLGYNLKMTEMQAAIGCAQIKKLPAFVQRRRENFEYLYGKLEHLKDKLILPVACENSKPSWFGFPLTCHEDVERDTVVRYLESHGVQTRMLFAGNITKQPCFSGVKCRVYGELTKTDIIMNKTFWVGVYPGMCNEALDYMAKQIRESVK